MAFVLGTLTKNGVSEAGETIQFFGTGLESGYNPTVETIEYGDYELPLPAGTFNIEVSGCSNVSPNSVIVGDVIPVFLDITATT